MLFSCFAVLSLSDTALPKGLTDLEKSVQAYHESVNELETETASAVAYAAKVHYVAGNETKREALQKELIEELNAKLPEAAEYSKAEAAVEDAATELRKAEKDRAAAQHALQAERAWNGQNASKADQAKYAKLQSDVAEANKNMDAARDHLDAKVAYAEKKSAALRQAAVEQADKISHNAHKLMSAAKEQESEAKKAMRKAIEVGRKESARLMRNGNVSERVGEKMEDQTEFWAERHEHAIENAGDSAQDDLERIYEPVLEMASRARSKAMDGERERAEKLRGLTRSADRLQLLAIGTTVEPDVELQKERAASWVGTGFSGLWGAWAGVFGAVAVMVGIVVRRRPVRMDAEPLLG
jgi:hypothetical protein